MRITLLGRSLFSIWLIGITCDASSYLPSLRYSSLGCCHKMFAEIGRFVLSVGASVGERDVRGFLISCMSFAKEAESGAATANIGRDVQSHPIGEGLTGSWIERETEQAAIRFGVAGPIFQLIHTHVVVATMSNENDFLDPARVMISSVGNHPTGAKTRFHPRDANTTSSGRQTGPPMSGVVQHFLKG